MREMKDSGVPWIGEIPDGWKRTSLLNVLRRRISDGPHETPTLLEEGIPFVSIDSLGHGDRVDFSEVKKFISSDDYNRYSKKTVIEEGDILFTKAATIGKTAIVGKERFMVWSPLAIIKTDCKKAINRYIYHLLNCDQLITSVVLTGSMNTQVNVGMRELEKTQITVPPLSEQQHIADFLDAKCGKIDSILEQTRASIEEYKKLKQSVITEAVTKGIRRNRSMKDSGSVWFTSIPINWDFKRLKYLFKIEKRIAGETGHTVLAITQRGVLPKNMDNGNGQFAEDYSNYQLVNPGDFAMNHMDLLTGWVDISRYSGVTSPDYRVFTITDKAKCHPAYYLYFMQMCYMDRIFYGLGQGVSGMGRWRLQADKFLNFRIPVPPMEEQQEIATYLDEKCAAIDSLIASKEALITELEAYKKSLIYEYVTGKKEVL